MERQEAKLGGSSRVLVASSAEAQREGIGQYIDLADGLELVRACSLDDATRYARGLKPRVAVICLSLTDDLDSTRAARLVGNMADHTRVAVIGFAMSAHLI